MSGVRQEQADAAAKLLAAEATDDELAGAAEVRGGAERAALGKRSRPPGALQRAELRWPRPRGG